MARLEKTVFISYRRNDVYTALAVYENLKNQGYDVFFDYRSISSGDFEQIITSNIRARAHFLLILTQTALDRCNEPGDWLRREIEIAMDEKRNIIPLLFKGFRFGAPAVTEKLTGKLKNLSRYNGLNVHEDYFDEAMQRLRTQYLSIPLNTVLHPVSTEVQKVVRAEQIAADRALEQIEDVQELVKHPEEKPELEKLESEAIQYELKGDFWNALQTYYKIRRLDPLFPRVDIKIAELEKEEQLKLKAKVPERKIEKPMILRLIGRIAVVMLVAALSIWGGFKLFNNMNRPVSTPGLDIGSTMTSDKDGMTLVYVPAGEFTMGSENVGASDERPAHEVTLDAFWIDKTEVTNGMYKLCVDAGDCQEPTSKESKTRSQYYGEDEFKEYPVVNVDWNIAKEYCEWAGRRLPTEAEWEKAARGENALVYPWGNEFDQVRLNFCDKNCASSWADESFDDGFADTALVGNYPGGASPYGALDMSGNVWEWVFDWYDPGYYAVSPATNPPGPDSGENCVMRGGSFDGDEGSVSTTYRNKDVPDSTHADTGFRCAFSGNEPAGSTPLAQAATNTSPPIATDTPSPTETSIPTTPTLGIGSTMISDKDGMTLLYVPAGEFTMGSDDGTDDEKPAHTVYLDAFWIDQTEITNAMYGRCVHDGACYEPGSKKSNTRTSYYGDSEFDDFPVIDVLWRDAKAYCAWADRRLPTEAEWEKAARGTDERTYPWGNSTPNNNLLNHNSAVGDTTEVGRYPNGASPYGALDMAGNVWEWVSSLYRPYPFTSRDGREDLNFSGYRVYRVLRGGSWFFSDVRSSNRGNAQDYEESRYTGFRCAMSATP